MIYTLSTILYTKDLLFVFIGGRLPDRAASFFNGVYIMRVYISGPITNNPDYVKQFEEAENKIKSMGYNACNPVRYANSLREKYGREPTWDEYLKFDLELLADCDAITMLPGWKDSKGAKLENEYALTHNKSVIELFLVKRKW